LFFWVLFPVVFLLGCQHQKPTKMDQVHRDMNPIPGVQIEELSIRDVDWDKAVILDLRSMFESGLDPLPRSFSFNAEDWTLPEESSSLFSQEVEQRQRRLALKGISPNTPVLFVLGSPEEEPLAKKSRTLLWKLGVKKMAIVPMKKFKKMTGGKKDWAILENVSSWRRPYRRKAPVF